MDIDQSGRDKTLDLCIVVSVFNEEEGLDNFYKNIRKHLKELNLKWQVIFVNDGSADNSGAIIDRICQSDENFVGIHFSRNFGHEAAMIAGIDYSNSRATICMDADLQHPPSKIKEMFDSFEEGADIINMIREENEDNSPVKAWMSKSFYVLLNRISPVRFVENASDFFLISRRVALVLKSDFRERNRFLRGFIQIIGFNKKTLTYNANRREFGESKYSFTKLLKLSFNAIVSFSTLPLHLGVTAGIIFGIFTIIVGIYSLVMWLTGDTPPGYTTLVVLVSFAFSVQFFLIGFIGIYIGNSFEETKKRPIYIVDRHAEKSN